MARMSGRHPTTRDRTWRRRTLLLGAIGPLALPRAAASRTAKALGPTIPPAVLGQADEVLE
jgi:hypothetical protein